jgi:hypothetical protein
MYSGGALLAARGEGVGDALLGAHGAQGGPGMHGGHGVGVRVGAENEQALQPTAFAPMASVGYSPALAYGMGYGLGGVGGYGPWAVPGAGALAWLQTVHAAVGSVGALAELASGTSRAVQSLASALLDLLESTGRGAGDVLGAARADGSAVPADVRRQRRTQLTRWVLGAAVWVAVAWLVRWAFGFGRPSSPSSASSSSAGWGDARGRRVVPAVVLGLACVSLGYVVGREGGEQEGEDAIKRLAVLFGRLLARALKVVVDPLPQDSKDVLWEFVPPEWARPARAILGPAPAGLDLGDIEEGEGSGRGGVGGGGGVGGRVADERTSANARSNASHASNAFNAHTAAPASTHTMPTSPTAAASSASPLFGWRSASAPSAPSAPSTPTPLAATAPAATAPPSVRSLRPQELSPPSLVERRALTPTADWIVRPPASGDALVWPPPGGWRE